MAWTQTDITKLEKAMAGGIRKVQYTSGSVEYQSYADMEKMLRRMKQEVSGVQPIRRTVGRFQSGF